MRPGRIESNKTPIEEIKTLYARASIIVIFLILLFFLLDLLTIIFVHKKIIINDDDPHTPFNLKYFFSILLIRNNIHIFLYALVCILNKIRKDLVALVW